MTPILTFLVVWAVTSVIFAAVLPAVIAFADYWQDKAYHDALQEHLDERRQRATARGAGVATPTGRGAGEADPISLAVAGRRSRRAPSIPQPSGQPGSADLM